MNLPKFFPPTLILFFNLLSLHAQELPEISDDLNSQIPVSDQVKIGKLPNGLTYYIRENRKPEKRLQLRLVVNAGSILEDEDQLGLAHFTEHMAFNGTKNFKKNELVNYLQSIGVEFGSDLNAYTSFDETVYILPIPTDDNEIVDKGFQIIRDWAGDFLFDHEEIDKERGVVIEEWRRGRGPDMRMLDKYLPVLFKGSKYAVRLPIGKKEVIENFPYEVIKRFYRDWYRPDLMAIVAVGDMPVDRIEKKIKALFSDLKSPVEPRIRLESEVPNHEETLVSIVTDRETSSTRVSTIFKHDTKSVNTLDDYKSEIIIQMIIGMLDERLNELKQKADPPFLYAEAYYGSSWARTKNAYQSSAIVDENGIIRGLKTLLTENERINRFGFTQSELDRYKLRMKKSMARAYKERDKTESGRLTEELINNFLQEEPIPGIEFEYAFMNKHLNAITLEEVNQKAKKLVTESNRVIVITAPEKEALELPSKEDVLLSLTSVSDMKLEPYREKRLKENLVDELPTAGSIVKESNIREIDVTKLELSNGITVFLKSTDFKNDQILFRAYRQGGHSIVNDDLYMSAKSADEVVSSCGIGAFSATDLRKVMAGKTVGVNSYIGELSEGMNGSCSPDDMETMFQLIHLKFLYPRRDEEAFQSLITRYKSTLTNVMADPSYYYSDILQRTLSQDHYRGNRIPTPEDINKIELNRALDFYKTRFGNPHGFVLWFVGNFEIEKIKPLLTQYLASIPTEPQDVKWKDLGVRPPSGKLQKDVFRGSEPKSSVFLTISKPFKYSRDQGFYLWVLGEILSIRLIEVIREKEGGVVAARIISTHTK